MSNEVAFANWWATEMKGQACPPVPRKLSELSMTAADGDASNEAGAVHGSVCWR